MAHESKTLVALPMGAPHPASMHPSADGHVAFCVSLAAVARNLPPGYKPERAITGISARGLGHAAVQIVQRCLPPFPRSACSTGAPDMETGIDDAYWETTKDEFATAWGRVMDAMMEYGCCITLIIDGGARSMFGVGYGGQTDMFNLLLWSLNVRGVAIPAGVSLRMCDTSMLYNRLGRALPAGVTHALLVKRATDLAIARWPSVDLKVLSGWQQRPVLMHVYIHQLIEMGSRIGYAVKSPYRLQMDGATLHSPMLCVLLPPYAVDSLSPDAHALLSPVPPAPVTWTDEARRARASALESIAVDAARDFSFVVVVDRDTRVPDWQPGGANERSVAVAQLVAEGSFADPVPSVDPEIPGAPEVDTVVTKPSDAPSVLRPAPRVGVAPIDPAAIISGDMAAGITRATVDTLVDWGITRARDLADMAKPNRTTDVDAKTTASRFATDMAAIGIPASVAHSLYGVALRVAA